MLGAVAQIILLVMDVILEYFVALQAALVNLYIIKSAFYSRQCELNKFLYISSYGWHALMKIYIGAISGLIHIFCTRIMTRIQCRIIGQIH